MTKDAPEHRSGVFLHPVKRKRQEKCANSPMEFRMLYGPADSPST